MDNEKKVINPKKHITAIVAVIAVIVGLLLLYPKDSTKNVAHEVNVDINKITDTTKYTWLIDMPEFGFSSELIDTPLGQTVYIAEEAESKEESNNGLLLYLNSTVLVEYSGRQLVIVPAVFQSNFGPIGRGLLLSFELVNDISLSTYVLTSSVGISDNIDTSNMNVSVEKNTTNGFVVEVRGDTVESNSEDIFSSVYNINLEGILIKSF